MIAPENKHFANCGDPMSAMSWRFVATSKHLVAASKHHPKKMQSGAGKSRCGDEPQSIAADEPNFIAVDVARIRLGNFLEILCKLPAGGRPSGSPPADAIQSSMTIGSAI
jgi:hypothetical protein